MQSGAHNVDGQTRDRLGRIGCQRSCEEDGKEANYPHGSEHEVLDCDSEVGVGMDAAVLWREREAWGGCDGGGRFEGGEGRHPTK